LRKKNRHKILPARFNFEKLDRLAGIYSQILAAKCLQVNFARRAASISSVKCHKGKLHVFLQTCLGGN
jgi:hypothetical protein